MNYTNYIGTLRNNLCELLTRQKDNREKIIKLNESIECILIVPQIEKPFCADLIVDELIRAIEFFEKINTSYETEILRLTKMLLDDTDAGIK